MDGSGLAGLGPSCMVICLRAVVRSPARVPRSGAYGIAYI
jgi:hypothetical protein